MSSAADVFAGVIRQHHESKMQAERAKQATNQYLVEQGVQGNLPQEQWITALGDLTKAQTNHKEKADKDVAETGADLHILQQGMQGKVEPELWQPALDRILKHPALKDHADAIRGSVARLTAPKIPPQPTPAPASPGQVPGTLQSLIGGNRDAKGVAQPDTSPVQPGAPPMAPLPGAVGFSQPTAPKELAAPPALPPVGAPEPVPPVAATPAPISPVGPSLDLQDPIAIRDKYFPPGVFLNPVQQRAASEGFKTELAQNQKLWEQQAGRRETRRQTQEILGPEKPGEDLSTLSPRKIAELGSIGVTLPYMRGMAGLIAPMNGGLTPGNAINASADVEGNPIDPNAQYRPLIDKVSKKPIGYVLQSTPSAFGYDADANQIRESKYGTPGAKTGAVAPSQVTPHVETTTSGGREFVTAANPNKPKPIAGAVSPQFVPTTSTTSTPGELPTTTTRTKGGGAAPRGVAPTPIPSVQGGGAPIAGAPLPAGDPVTVAAYQGWVGGGPAPTGKGLKAVQLYASQHGLPTPTPLTAQGTKDLTQIDGVLSQIKALKQKMDERGMSKKDDLSYYPDYLKYAHGGKSTPNQDIWTGISFERLRSAASALQGTNSRALPIMREALAHTPNPAASMSSLPETPKKMYGKLVEMEEILNKGKSAILADQRKSGVVAAPEPVEGGDKVKALLEKHGF